MERYQKKKDNRIRCKNCKGTKFKIVHTHGMKSRGYKVCKDCGELIR